MKKQSHYLVVDDDTTNNLICNYTIQHFDKDAVIKVFKEPEMALDFMGNKECDPGTGCTILFLDFNMPTMTGFEFLKEYEKFELGIKEHYRIYILTSSIEDFSSQAINFPRVKGFLSKPLQRSYLVKIHQDIEDEFK